MTFPVIVFTARIVWSAWISRKSGTWRRTRLAITARQNGCAVIAATSGSKLGCADRGRRVVPAAVNAHTARTSTNSSGCHRPARLRGSGTSSSHSRRRRREGSLAPVAPPPWPLAAG